MRAVITVIGKDNVGILHKVSGVCAKYEANVLEVTQSVLQDMFAMIMMVDITGMTTDFTQLSDELNGLGETLACPSTQCTKIFSTQCIVSNNRI